MTGRPPPGVPGLELGRAGLVEADEGREPEAAREIAAAVTKSKKVSETSKSLATVATRPRHDRINDILLRAIGAARHTSAPEPQGLCLDD